MKNRDARRFSFSVAEMVGVGSCSLSFLLAFVDVKLAVIPLASFLLLCIVAPFLPRVGFFLPVISRGKSRKRAVAITFDDGPDPLSTPQLLRLLQRYEVKATFFVTGKRASEYPEVIREILALGHAVGNHTYSHDSLIMLRSGKTLRDEIASTQKVLSGLGIRTYAFRSPAGITGPRLQPVLEEYGLSNINFSCRAVDGGNKRIHGLSRKILDRLRPDDIVALHDTRPKDEGLLVQWLKEIELILLGAKEKGFAILPLSELIEKTIMTTETGGREKGDQVALGGRRPV
jgi:peptidoglycan/xylan/chitin deacetylase (PgdA/CDA1 family)